MQHTSFTRVKLALEHKEPDRIPFDIGGTAVTGINIKALRRLRKYLGLSEKVEQREKITQVAKIDNDMIEKLKIDFKNVRPEAPSKPGPSKYLGLEGNHYRLIDEFGIGWQMPVENGHFYDLYLHPLKNAKTVEDIRNYPWPDPLDSVRYANLKNSADHVVDRGKKGLCSWKNECRNVGKRYVDDRS